MWQMEEDVGPGVSVGREKKDHKENHKCSSWQMEAFGKRKGMQF